MKNSKKFKNQQNNKYQIIKIKYYILLKKIFSNSFNVNF